jgi:uncharacterized membrane protein YqhA
MTSKQTSSTPEEGPVHDFGAVGAVLRALMIIPVVALSIAAAGLLIYGAFETWHLLDALFGAHKSTHDEAILLAIEIIDLFLLAVVVQVVSLGIYQLYFRQDLHLPRWLKIVTLDDLKSKLVGVVVTVLAVFFLGRVVTWQSGPDVLYLGGGVAVVIVALTWFLSKIDAHEE